MVSIRALLLCVLSGSEWRFAVFELSTNGQRTSKGQHRASSQHWRAAAASCLATGASPDA